MRKIFLILITLILLTILNGCSEEKHGLEGLYKFTINYDEDVEGMCEITNDKIIFYVEDYEHGYIDDADVMIFKIRDERYMDILYLSKPLKESVSIDNINSLDWEDIDKVEHKPYEARYTLSEDEYKDLTIEISYDDEEVEFVLERINNIETKDLKSQLTKEVKDLININIVETANAEYKRVDNNLKYSMESLEDLLSLDDNATLISSKVKDTYNISEFLKVGVCEVEIQDGDIYLKGDHYVSYLYNYRTESFDIVVEDEFSKFELTDSNIPKLQEEEIKGLITDEAKNLKGISNFHIEEFNVIKRDFVIDQYPGENIKISYLFKEGDCYRSGESEFKFYYDISNEKWCANYHENLDEVYKTSTLNLKPVKEKNKDYIEISNLSGLSDLEFHEPNEEVVYITSNGNGLYAAGWEGEIFTSDNGSYWNMVQIINGDPRHVAVSQDTYLVGTYDSLYISRDINKWEKLNLTDFFKGYEDKIDDYTFEVNGMHHIENKFLISVSARDNIPNMGNYILTIDDNFKELNTYYLNEDYNSIEFEDVCYENGVYYLVYGDGFYSTEDFLHLEKVEQNITISKIYRYNDKYIGYGSRYIDNKSIKGIFVSNDLKDWKMVYGFNNGMIKSFYKIDEGLVAYGSHGLIISKDGLNWYRLIDEGLFNFVDYNGELILYDSWNKVAKIKKEVLFKN